MDNTLRLYDYDTDYVSPIWRNLFRYCVNVKTTPKSVINAIESVLSVYGATFCSRGIATFPNQERKFEFMLKWS